MFLFLLIIVRIIFLVTVISCGCCCCFCWWCCCCCSACVFVQVDLRALLQGCPVAWQSVAVRLYLCLSTRLLSLYLSVWMSPKRRRRALAVAFCVRFMWHVFVVVVATVVAYNKLGLGVYWSATNVSNDFRASSKTSFSGDSCHRCRCSCCCCSCSS